MHIHAVKKFVESFSLCIKHNSTEMKMCRGYCWGVYVNDVLEKNVFVQLE